MIKPRTNKLDIKSEIKNSEEGRLIVTHKESSFVYYLIKNNRLVSFYVENSTGVIPGAVYSAVVLNFNKASGGYFLKISEKTKCYLPDNEIGKAPVISGGTSRDRLCEGDVVLVYIKKEAYKEKLAQCSCKLSKNPFLNDNTELLESIVNKGKHSVKYTKLFEGNSFISDLIFSGFLSEEDKIICEDNEAYDYVKKIVSLYWDEPQIKVYDDKTISINSLYGLNSKFENISSKKVWLNNGGTIVIEPTEAMIVIDVNSGKLDGKDNREENILKLNIEAACEIAYQIQARNLSGIIIIDFVNMKSKENVTILINKIKDELQKIKPSGIFVDITKLGLVEITRPKKRPDIYEIIRRNNKNILL